VSGESGDSDCPDDWYREAFGAEYLELYGHRDDASARREIGELLRLLDVSGGARALDCACGAGRHLQAMLEAGLDAWGIDLSAELLREASRRPGVAGRVVRADMRRLPFGEVFDVLLNLFSSFGYFQAEAENAAALRSMVACLRPGGRLVMDHANRRYVESTLAPHSREQREDITIEHRRRIENDRVVKHTEVTRPTGQRQYVESLRLYYPDELAGMFEAAGLGEPTFFGSTAGEPLTDESKRMIAIASKR
jgi:SAM-dependent methyltransferase